MPIKKTKTISPLKDRVVFDNLIKFAIAPRPICLASTIDRNGKINLSPFSYFNFVSQNPPVCVFSPLLRMRDGSTKHTLDNLIEVPELVINIVNYQMVQQQSLASTEYAKQINEFEKAGFTIIPSIKVSPPRVAESPVQLECIVKEIIPIGKLGGAGNLVLAEIVFMHIQEHLINEDNEINQADLDLVARLGANWYCRVTKDSLFEVPKPLRTLGIGVDKLPKEIRLSKTLSGNHLGLLANIESIPQKNMLAKNDIHVLNILKQYADNSEQRKLNLHKLAATYLDQNKFDLAWQVLLLEC